ncbi:MAG: Co2+/Mg2+ efflux protein ApaG [Planctomycetota bacterium]
MSRTNSNIVTEGIRIQAAAQFMPAESDPDRGRFIFVYRIRITNQGTETVQLLTRDWVIIDANGRRETVHGDGVVGKQPILSPGETFEYTSYCPMRTEWGTMEGHFTFVDIEGRTFKAGVGRFYMATTTENVILS